jgi:hypothetical protein
MTEDAKLALALCAGFALVLLAIISPFAFATHAETMAHIANGRCRIGSDAWIPCAAFRTEAP